MYYSKHKVEKVKWKHDFDIILIDFVVFLSILYLIILAVDLYFPNSEKILFFIILFDTFVSLIFLFEFFYFFIKSNDKSEYTKKNFTDLLAAFPGFLFFYFFSSFYFFFNTI